MHTTRPLYLLRLLVDRPIDPEIGASGVLTVVPHGAERPAAGEAVELPAKELEPEAVAAFVEREIVPRLIARREKGEVIALEARMPGQLALQVQRLLPGGIDRVVGSSRAGLPAGGAATFAVALPGVDAGLPGPVAQPTASRPSAVADTPESPRPTPTTSSRKVGPAAPEPAAPSLPDLLRDLQKLATWHGPSHARVEAVASGILERYPDARPRVDGAISRGDACRLALRELERRVRERGPEAEETRGFAEELRREYPEIRPTIRKKLDYAARARRRRLEARDRRARGEALSTVRPGRPDHRIDRLPASPAFTLVIDETGSAFDTDDTTGTEGRLVGLLVPAGVELPPLPHGAHAADDALADVDARVQAVLDAPVGILGITTGAFAHTPGDLWSVGVAELIHWVARLLPLAGETALDVRIEARGSLAAGASCEALRAEIARSLAETDPARYGRLRLDIQPVPKDGHPWLAYADALAYTWGSRAEASRTRFRQSGLAGTCLLGGAAPALQALREILWRGPELDADAWQALVSAPEAENETSLVATQLARLGETCRDRPEVWRRFFAATRRHLESKALRLAALGREVAWLERHAPEGVHLGARLRLAWLVAQLETRNHHGDTERGPQVDELRALCDRLFTEDPTLVCQAELDLAVLATNRFEFAAASAALARFRDRPPEVPGLRHWGRVQSSFGQHAAFEGRFERADGYFARALEAFQRLSDPEEAAGEITQTGTYRAIAAMDDPRADTDTVRRRVAALLPLSPDGIARLAASTEAREKYLHHLLVRYLVERGSPGERGAYLAARNRWANAEGHPWPLVEAYRGLLLAEVDRDAALAHLEEARSLAFRADQGPIVLLIGATIAVAAQGLGAPATVSDDELRALADLLPGAAPRIERLREARRHPRDPLALLREVLPFNFR